jgi:large subunit ribosomal protein L23Ae
VKKGSHTAKKSKVWNKTTFTLPKTLSLARKPISLKKSVKKESTWDKYSIIKHPLSSESAIKTIEDHNTLVFVVDKRARKPAIKKACQELYNIRVAKVNTLITPKGNKKAYVVLSKVHDALEIANKIGIM